MIRELIAALTLTSMSNVLSFSSSFTPRQTNNLVALQYRTVADTATTSTTTTPIISQPSILKDFDHHTNDRLPYSPGYSKWQWLVGKTTHSINYLEMGDPSKPAILLVQ